MIRLFFQVYKFLQCKCFFRINLYQTVWRVLAHTKFISIFRPKYDIKLRARIMRAWSLKHVPA